MGTIRKGNRRRRGVKNLAKDEFRCRFRSFFQIAINPPYYLRRIKVVEPPNPFRLLGMKVDESRSDHVGSWIVKI